MMQNIDQLAMQPGVEGSLFRLVKEWNPDGVGRWLQAERLRQTPAMDLPRCVGQVMAAAVYGFGLSMNDGAAAVTGPHGVIRFFERDLQRKISTGTVTRTAGGIYVPAKGEIG